HLAASVYLQMALNPHIVHVVSFTEADHAATAEDVIDSCRMARKAIENALGGQPDMTADQAILKRKSYLIEQAGMTLQAISDLGTPDGGDALIDPQVLANAVKSGILDAPQLAGNPFAQGKIRAGLRDGGWDAISPDGSHLPEDTRLMQWL
ncbi:MAG: methionine synthase, partial [Anaerolineaceae bacterium]|nr:methionine synthase [Anaerolineaceae bacterium]